MKKKKVLLILALAAGVAAFAGCQSTDSTDPTASAEAEADSSASGEETVTADDIESTVVLNKTYWSGSTVRVRMLFDEEGNCRYGYVGYYTLQTSEDGYPIVTFVYYADTDEDQMAGTTYALRDNGDGTYDKTLYTEDEEPDFDDTSVTMTLSLSEGTDGILGSSYFDGIYEGSDGRNYTFTSDGIFYAEVWLEYVADEDYIVMNGSDSSTIYTYTADEDYDSITLYKDGSKVMDLAAEEATETEAEETDTSE
ncbi:MAG: hypothetical protein LUC32_02190 [Clostridiales bacterium]|nr:hypothetical protein [Clostridiales bacterium]